MLNICTQLNKLNKYIQTNWNPNQIESLWIEIESFREIYNCGVKEKRYLMYCIIHKRQGSHKISAHQSRQFTWHRLAVFRVTFQHNAFVLKDFGAK